MKTILLYGHSLWFDALIGSFPEQPNLHIVRADAATLYQLQQFVAIDLIVADTAADVNALDLFRLFPAAVLLVVDLATGRLTVLQGQSTIVSTVQEVVHVMRGITAVRAPLALAPTMRNASNPNVAPG